MTTKIEELEELLAKAAAGGGEKYQARHRERGKQLARERIELLLDRDTPYLELSTLAGWGTEKPLGANSVTGIGVVNGVEVMISANDPTSQAGASNKYSLAKTLRAQNIARQNRLPLINLVESGGADLPDQAEVFLTGGKWFRNLTQLSRIGIPTIALVFGNSTAGGAYVPGMCDYSVMIQDRSKVFLGGPPLVKMATGEESTDEELGGAEMHSRVSGLSDYFARDEHEAIRMGRDIVGHLNWRKHGYGPTMAPDDPVHDPDDLLGIIPADLRRPFDMREVVARVVDGSRFEEYKALYGTSMLTGWASVHGYPVGIVANQQGVIFSDEAQKVTEFIQLCNRYDIWSWCSACSRIPRGGGRRPPIRTEELRWRARVSTASSTGCGGSTIPRRPQPWPTCSPTRRSISPTVTIATRRCAPSATSSRRPRILALSGG
jgi:acetyl-CoA carboxylase carboxyltransferase component